jgi:hypothetical protein
MHIAFCWENRKKKTTRKILKKWEGKGGGVGDNGIDWYGSGHKNMACTFEHNKELQGMSKHTTAFQNLVFCNSFFNFLFLH